MRLTLKVRENLTATTAALIAELRGPGTVTAAAVGVANETRDWFAGLEQTRPNKMGFPRSHFWSDVRGSVQNPQLSGDQAATVAITHVGIRQRLEGGKIVPLKGEYLTIPANAQAYSHLAREFHNLHFGFAENRYGGLSPALIENTSQEFTVGRKKKDGTRTVKPGRERGGEVFFWLVRQVYQPADPSVLPPEERLVGAVEKAVGGYARNLIARAKGAAASVASAPEVP